MSGTGANGSVKPAARATDAHVSRLAVTELRLDLAKTLSLSSCVAPDSAKLSDAMLIARRLDPRLYSCTACPSSRGGCQDDELREVVVSGAGYSLMPGLTALDVPTEAGPSSKGIMHILGVGRSGRMRFCRAGMQ